MSDTPETDALERRFGNKMPEKMRNLERQRDEARRELVRIDAAYGKKVVLAAALLRERDAATDLARELRDVLSAINFEAGKQWQATQPLPCIGTIEKLATHAIDKFDKLLCN